MKKLTLLTCAAFFALTGAAWAEFQKLDSQRDFVSVVEGKTLTRPLVELRVTESGGISGTGAVWDVSGQWVWKGGYFCRSSADIWGDDDLGYNCQEVAVNGGKIRFTSDKGAGQSAVFSLK